MWARLPEIDLIDVGMAQLAEPVPVGDADIGCRWPIFRRHRASACLAEPLVAFSQEVNIRSEGLLAWDRDGLAVEPLQPDLEHRTVGLAQHIMSDLDPQIGSNTKNVGVECGVMQLAQRQPVRNNGVASRILVREDMCCVE